jgi:hypothetical protein
VPYLSKSVAEYSITRFGKKTSDPTPDGMLNCIIEDKKTLVTVVLAQGNQPLMEMYVYPFVH